MMPTSVEPSGVIVSPSMPWFATRFANSRGNVASNGDSRPIWRPLASKWITNGPYSSETQNVPSGNATKPSGS